jgi:hypothetical protein
VNVEPAVWDELLDRLGCPDAYLRHAYVTASAILDGGRPVFLHFRGDGGDVVFTASIRPIPGASGLYDATTPYGYGGPVAIGVRPPVEAFWTAYEDWCSSNRVVSTFVRFHPLFENHRYAPAALTVEPLADTIAWRLDDGQDLFQAMHRHHRRVVRSAERQVEVSVRESPAKLEAFAALYETSMRRHQADAFYIFPPAYWEALLTGLGEKLVLFEHKDGEGVAAATLCLASPPWLHYHLGATSDRARRLGAANLLMLTTARWARERKFSIFHLGGGVGGHEDSVWEYKRRFSPSGRREMRIGKAVHDVGAYLELAGAETLDLHGFFPAYRRHLSASV